jgi:23S rRNA (guanine745-N1)-methyltransferase
MPLTLTCPLCRAALQRGPASWRCGNGHAFDVAREGYVNLLPVQHRKSRAPGDNADMVRARREFLDAGHYAPLRESIAALLSPLQAGAVLDLGCGEGYYTGALHTAAGITASKLTATDAAAAGETVGIDISREAIQRAAKRHAGITWLVAGSAALPLADACCDLVASLFAPVSAAEIARVLKPGGHVLVAAPAADHLQALREILFETVRPHDPAKSLTALLPDFTEVTRREVRFALSLDAAALRQLLLMTPYGWRATAARREALLAREHVEAEAAFMLFLLRRADA